MVDTHNTKKLYTQLDIACKELKKAKNSDERVALVNYIGNLNAAIATMEDEKIIFDKGRIYGSHKNQKKFLKKLDIYEDRMLDSFVLNKDFHSNYMGEVLSGIEDNMAEIPEEKISPTTMLKESDFYDIFYQFMKSIKLDKLFDKFIKEKKIYSTITPFSEGNLGFTLYNPVNKDIDIFVNDFEYNIHSMFTLAHEFGHAYDLNNFNEDISVYNKYFYRSFYGEVISKTFERLFLDYMLKNKILLKESQDKLFESEMINHSYILGSYMLSLLPDSLLHDGSYANLDKDKFITMIKNNFIDEDSIRKFIYESVAFDLIEDFTYAYGDIISMFIHESVRDCGFSNDLVEEFLRLRSNLFDEEFMRKWGMGPENYVKLHKKEIECLKK